MHPATHQPVPFEQAVRNLAEIGWSTRQISRQLRHDYPSASQSTVVRTIARINTGPNPILRADGDTQPQRALPAGTRPEPVLNHAGPDHHPPNRPPPRTVGPAALLVIALLVTAAAATGLAWGRYARPAPAVTACVRYNPAGTVTGITAATAACPPGWTTLVLPAAP